MTQGDEADPETVGEVLDGRALRWQEHNAARRADLVDACLRAVRAHGAGVSMDAIATVAETSKTVIYRHFTDRAGLYRAVAEKVGRRIEQALQGVMAGDVVSRATLGAVIDAYLALMEADPEVYRFVVRPPALEGLVAEREVFSITDRAARMLAGWLDTAVGGQRSRVWSVAIVGAVHACADRWLAEPEPLDRAVLVEELVVLTWGGLGPVAAGG
ncbi:MAG TPA: TetR/AcrR family transcriptional regulator [Propionibacterium sp.]|nr:TetR/AcrR family transcriptional regulator [Propionibacterium sp.]